MKKKNIGILLTCMVLGAGLCGTAVPAKAAEAPVRAGAVIQAAALKVSSYKGESLTAGERSMLVVSPYGTVVTAVSSNPGVIELEQIHGYYVMVAKAPGFSVVSITDEAGTTANMTMTVMRGEPSSDAPPSEGSSPAQTTEDSNPAINSEWSHNPDADLTSNMEVRQEMIRLINQVRQENGRTELPVNESLMNAAQDVSSQCVTEHRPYDHKALIRYGWPYAGMYNLTAPVVYGCPDIAKEAVNNWVNSSGHLQTMLMEEASCVGTGVTISGGRAYCYMVVGDPTAHNPYEQTE